MPHMGLPYPTQLGSLWSAAPTCCLILALAPWLCPAQVCHVLLASQVGKPDLGSPCASDRATGSVQPQRQEVPTGALHASGLLCKQATHRAPEGLLGHPPGPGASQHGPSRGAGAMQLLRRATAALQGGGTPAASPAATGPPEGGWLTEGKGSGLDAPGAAALAASDVLTGEPVSDDICRSATPLKQCRDVC